jgi:hypothetical protein
MTSGDLVAVSFAPTLTRGCAGPEKNIALRSFSVFSKK